jgi:hypothetical protein
MCSLLLSLRSAEVDCTIALQLDSTYVKAYQRRAMARSGLGQLQEARSDLLKVMELEPENMASKAELMKLEKKLNIKSQPKVIVSYYYGYSILIVLPELSQDGCCTFEFLLMLFTAGCSTSTAPVAASLPYCHSW